MLTAFKQFLSTLKLSPISRKLYLADVRHFLTFLGEPVGITQTSDPKSYSNYLASLHSQAIAPSMLKRTIASLKQFASFVSLTYRVPNPLSSALSSNPSELSIYQKYIKHFTNYLIAERLSPLTIKSYKSDITRYLEWLGSDFTSTNATQLLSEKNIEKYLNHLTESNVALPSTIERKLKSIARFQAWYTTTYPSLILPDNNKKANSTFTTTQIESIPASTTDIPVESVKKINSRIPRFSLVPNLRNFLSFAILLIFVASLSVFGYRQFSKDVRLTAAFPSTPVTPNRQLSFQGRLEDAGGTPITSATNLTFKLWDDPSAGSQLYSSGVCSITPDTDGVFSTQIGDTCGAGISSSVFTENADVYLEVTVAAETLTPRQQIATVAYALNSETIQGFPISATVSAIRNTVVPMNQWGEIIVGEQSPRMRGVSGTFQISAPTLALATNTGTNGNISLSPDGAGQVNLYGNTTTTNFFNVSNAQLTTGSLITGTAANNNTGFKLIDLLSGSSPASKFSVSDSGNTTIAGTLTLPNSNTLTGVSNYTQFSNGVSVGGGTTYYINSTGTGNLNDLTVNGNFTANGTNNTLGNSPTDNIDFQARVLQDSDLIPITTTGTNDLGSGALPWDNVYAVAFNQNGNTVCDISGNCPSATQYWRSNLGTLSPINDTYDLLLGANATSSAKIGFININTGIPTINLANQASNIAIIDNTTNAIQILEGANPYLAVSTGNTTENISFGNGTTNPSYSFLGSGTSTFTGAIDSNGDLSVADTNIAFDGASTIFTITGTFNLNPGGATVIGDGGDTLSLDSSDWDISTVGNMTGIGTISSNGDWTNSQASPSILLTDSTASADDYTINVDANAFNIINSTDSRTELNFDGAGGIDLGENTATKTINLGGNTNSASDTINIATNATAADVISIGNNHTSTTLSLVGGDDWSITSTGDVTFSGNHIFGNAITDSIDFQARVLQDSDLIPITTTGTNDLGSASLPWDNVYAVAFNQNGNTVCDSSGNCPGSTQYWRSTLGTLSPLNDTVDLLIGASATASAKFGFINVNSGTPTATISGNLALAVPTGATPANTLNLFNGGSLNIQTSPGGNTGLTSRLFIAKNGNIGISNSNPNYKLDFGNDSNGVQNIWDMPSGTIYTSNLYAKIINDFDNSSYYLDPASAVISLNANGAINTNGNLQVLGITQLGNANTDTLTINAGSSGSGISFGDSSFAACTALETVGGVLTCGSDDTGSQNLWRINQGALSPINDTLDLLVGANATSSAHGGFIGINSGTPTATVSAGVAGGTFMTADGYLSTTARQSLTLGNSTSYDTTGNILLNPNGTGNVGIGTATPSTKVEISDTTTTKLRVINSAAGSYIDLSSGIGGPSLDLYASSTMIGNIGSNYVGTDIALWARAGRSLVFGTNNAHVASFDTSGNFLPATNDTNNLGSDSLRFKDLYLGGETLHLGTSTTDEGTISYNTSTNILNIGTDSTTNGTIQLGDAATDKLDFQARVLQDADLIPITTTGTNDLGASSLPWDNIYANNLTYGAAGSVTIADNTANAYQLKEGANVYLDITTTDNVETFTLNLPVGGGTSHTANLFNANIAQTINIGTGTAVDTINIGTGGTNTDDINLGGLATSHIDITGVTNFAGGTTYFVDASGNAKFLDLQVADTGNPGLTVGNGTIGFAKIGGSTISDNSGNLTLDSDSAALTIAADDTTLTATGLATLDMAATVAWDVATLNAASLTTLNAGALATIDSAATVAWDVATLNAASLTTLNAGLLATIDSAATVAWDATTVTLGGSATINGGSASSGTLTLVSTTNGTKGNIQFFSSSNTIDSSGNLIIAGDLRINGNDILDSAGTTRITTGATTTLTNTTTTLSGTSTLTASSLATLDMAATVAWDVATLNATTLSSFDTASSLTLGTTTLTLDSNSTINGGSAANDDITIQGTSNATRTTSYVILQPTAGNVGIGTSAPGRTLTVNGDIGISSATGKLYDTFVTAGISLGATSETALSGFGATSIVGALNELKNVDKNTSHNDYLNWTNHYVAKNEGSTDPNNKLSGLFFDNFFDSTKFDGTTSTTSGIIQTSDPKAQVHPAAPYRVGLMGGQTYQTSATTTDNDGQGYLGANAVTDIYYYDRTRDSSPEVLVELGIDPNWYNGVTLSVATSSATYSQAGTLATKNPNLTTRYNGSLIKVTGTDSTPRTIYITIKTPTTFDWTNYQGDAATGVTITPGTAQTLGVTGVSVTFSAANYNVGDVFRIASWFIEPEGTSPSTRGAKQQFPERSNIVATASSVDIIDADSQKLWMRFSQGTNFGLQDDTNNNPSGVKMLNGNLGISMNGSAGIGLIYAHFDSDAIQNVNATYIYTAYSGISLRNSTIWASWIRASTQNLVTAIANDVDMVVSPNQPTQEMTVSGWGYIVGDSTSKIEETVYLPYKFNTVPLISISTAGQASTTAPVSLSSCATATTAIINAEISSVTSSNFIANLVAGDTVVFGSTTYMCYTWTATGIVAPKQFIAVPTGSSSTDGGLTLLNDTDGTEADLFVGSQFAGTQYSNKIALTSNGGMYFSQNDVTNSAAGLEVYYGIHGLSTESSWAAYYAGVYRLATSGSATWSNGGPVIRGTSTTDTINSLYVTENTSSIDPSSNTIYAGTSLGVTVIQEKQGHGNGSDSLVERDGSAKWYTTNYISEEAVGDLRGMWLLNNSNASSDLEDISVYSNALTGTNIAAGTDSVSGVRGTATDFDGSTEYLSIADDPDFDFSTAFTSSFWLKTSDTSGDVLEKFQTSTEQKLVAIASGTVQFYLYNVMGGTSLFSNRTVNDNNWHHIVTTYDGTTATIYIDGKADSSKSASGDIADGTGALYIMRDTAGVNYLSGVLDDLQITATPLTPQQVKKMYQTGYRALQSHSTSLGSSGADTQQQLGYISTGTNVVGAALPDFNNQYMYVGLNSTTLGAVSKIQLNSDSNIKTFTASANVPTGGTTVVDEDVSALGVGYNLETVGSAASGVKSIAPDNNANGTIGTLYSETQTLASSTKFAYLWVSRNKDASDTSSNIIPYGCVTQTTAALCTSNSAWVAGTPIQVDNNQTPAEQEYSFAFPTAGANLTLKFEIYRGSTKTNTYISQYGIMWGSSVGGADIAERYKSNEPAYPGDILSIADPGDSHEALVTLASRSYDQKAIGVVTTNPGIVMDENLVDLNWNAASRNSPDRPAVALAGRVPVKVSTKNGVIMVGDPITTSTQPGVGIKATQAGTIIGKALEKFDCNSTSAVIDVNDPTICTGTVLTFVNVGHYEPIYYLSDAGEFIFTGHDLENDPSASPSGSPIFKLVRVLADGSKEVVDRIGTFGSVISGSLKTQELAVDTISPIASGSAIKLNAPVVIAPKAESTSELPALIVEGEIEATTISARLANLEELKADRIVAGEIIADSISANSITGLDARIASLSAGTTTTLSDSELNSITDRIKSRLANLTGSNPTAQDLPIPVPSDSLVESSATDFSTYSLASDSAMIANLSADFVTINNYLAVVGSATITDLNITNTFTTNSISSLSNQLALQPLGGIINLAANTLIVDSNGQVAINGDLTITGAILADSANLNSLSLGSAATSSATSALGKLLAIYNEAGEQVASINASGSANLASLTTQMITIAAGSSATDSATLTSTTASNATAGTSILTSPNTEILIASPFVTRNSLVYLTPTGFTDNKVVFVKSKVSCDVQGSQLPNNSDPCESSFTVGIDSPASQDISFNWWIIELK